MSYLSYTPDVRPPPADQTVPPRSGAGRWLIAALAYLALMVGWLWWMTLPMKILPPLAAIPLPDGTELRLIHVARGDWIEIDSYETFGDRVNVKDERYSSSVRLPAPRESTWLIFTQYNPRTRRCTFPDVSGIWIAEENPPFLHKVVASPHNGDFSWQAYYVDVAPRRGATWKLEVDSDKKTVVGTIPNPNPATDVTEFVAQPLPQKQTVDGATFELLDIGFTGRMDGRGKLGNTSFRGRGGDPTSVPRCKISMGDLGDKDLFHTYQFFDATGNVTSQGVLPFSEPAWGLKVRATQVKFTAASPGVVTLLGEATVPGPSEIIALSVPPALAAQGVTDLVLVGPGGYAVSRELITTQGPDGKTHATKLASTGMVYSMSLTNVCLFILSSKRIESRSRGSYSNSYQLNSNQGAAGDLVYQLHDGVKAYRAQGSGNASRTESRPGFALASELHSYDFIKTSPDKLKPGTKIRVEAVKPESAEATFYFPAPDPAKQK